MEMTEGAGITSGTCPPAAAAAAPTTISQWPKLVLFNVGAALSLDYMLRNAVVTIIPERLWENRHTFLKNYTPLNYIEANVSSRVLHGEKLEQNMADVNLISAILLASKAFAQLVASPIVGKLSIVMGHGISLLAGFFSIFCSAIIYAFGVYAELFVANILQGIGSACVIVSGFGILAQRFSNDKKRGIAMGVALALLELGFGADMYGSYGNTKMFLILALIALGVCLLQLLTLGCAVGRLEPQATQTLSYKELLQDKYIVVVAGSIILGNFGFVMLESSLPFWMMDKLDLTMMQFDDCLKPAFYFYIIGALLFGWLGHCFGRWRGAMLGFVTIGICFICIPWVTSFGQLFGVTGGVGFGIGMVNSCVMPELGRLIDTRHNGENGAVYAIVSAAFSIQYAIGIIAFHGVNGKYWSLDVMVFAIAIAHFVYAPLLLVLKSPRNTNGQAVSC